MARPAEAIIYGQLLKYTDFYMPHVIPWKRPFSAACHYALSMVNPFLGGFRRWLKKRKTIRETELNNTIKSLNYPKGKKLAKLVFAYDQKFMTRRIWESSWFNETVQLPFEMLTLPAPAGYKKFLDTFYGNWHEYVIRYRHADFYDTERPYTYYVNKEDNAE